MAEGPMPESRTPVGVEPAAIDLPAERARRLDATPLARATGFELVACWNGRADAILPTLPANRAAEDDDAIHPSALIGFLDHLAGYAVASLVPGHVGISTMELQVALTGARPHGAVRGAAECVGPPGDSTLVRGEAVDEAGQVVATCSGWFAVGAFPGGFSDSSGIEEPVPDLGEVVGPYERLIGLEAAGEGDARLLPDVVPAIGWIGLPALHGGAIAAVLVKACEERLLALRRPGFRLATITIRYLRAARAEEGLLATAVCDWPGRRAAHLAVRCAPEAGRDCAQAQAFFVPVK
ncbi:MAG: PaaI family thioesterase [Sphingobium sp.]